MLKICLNGDVWDSYRKGYDLNDAITEVFSDEIKARVDANPKMADLTPMQMVMLDAGIKKTGTLGDLMSMKVNNSAYTSGGIDTNQWLFPAWVETTLREKIYEKDWLPYIVSTRLGIDGNTIQSPTLDLTSTENKKAIKKARIAELADIPIGKITVGEQAITLWKHGRAIQLSYEVARRMKIELFMIHMRAIASDLARQEIEAAVDVALNGDGNTGSAAQEISTTASSTITGKDITHALVEYAFANNINATTLVVPKSQLEVIADMTFDSQLRAGTMQVSFNIPQIDLQNLTVIGVPELKVGSNDVLLLLNRDQTLTRYQENGSNIQEIENYIRNQSRLMTMTENSGYAINTTGTNAYIKVKSGTGT